MTEYIYEYTTEIISGKSSSLVNIAVMIQFFNRSYQLAKVFEQVKRAKPSVVLLYQDGARDGNSSDVFKMEECRKIVADIDWNCTVYRFYQKNNFGCDPSGYISRKWAFSIVNKCIILEDDCVPSISFFEFCKQMLDKYENDTRVYRISGQNILGEYSPYNSDYFFTKGGSIWGWASWKRVLDEWDTNYQWLDDPKVVECVCNTYKNGGVLPTKFLKTFREHRKSKKDFFESIFYSCRMLGTGLTIVPSVNLISNIGISDEATHGASNIRLINKKQQIVFNAKLYELEFPLEHPKYVLEDKRYEELQSKAMGWRNNILEKISGKVEEKLRQILFRK